MTRINTGKSTSDDEAYQVLVFLRRNDRRHSLCHCQCCLFPYIKRCYVIFVVAGVSAKLKLVLADDIIIAFDFLCAFV